MEGFTYRAVNGDDSQVYGTNFPGPKRKRKFTDIICLFVFLGTLGFSVYTFIVGFSDSHFGKLVLPYDSDGNPCGKHDVRDLSDYKYLYFNTRNPVVANLTDKAQCVNKCPTSDKDAIRRYPTEHFPPGSPFWGTETSVLWGRFCIPTSNEGLFKNIIGQFYQISLGALLESARHEVTLLAIFAAVSLVAAFIYSRLMQWWARFSVYSTMILFPCFLITLVIICNKKYRALQQLAQSSSNEFEMTIHSTASVYLFCFLALLSMMAMLLVMGILLCDRIRLSIRVIQAASDFITEVKRIQLVPLVLYILLVGYFWYWWTAVSKLYSDGDPTFSQGYSWAKINMKTTTM